MRLRVDGREYRGRALDVRHREVDPTALASAIRDADSAHVDAPSPGPAHPFVGLLVPDMSLSLTSALAAAARSWGRRSRFHDAITTTERAIDDVDPDPVDLVPARRRAAQAGADVAARREEVARLRGRLEADREAGRSTEDAQRALREAITALSEAETEALAADQALEAAEREARAVRDERDRRLALVDERDNLVRRARAALAARAYPRFRRALSALPVDARPGETPGEYAGDRFAAGLAVARIARLSAPVVLANGPFSTAVAARAALDAQVVLV